MITNFLLRLFVKTDSKNPEYREKCGTLAGVVGILCNLVLFAAKLIAGILTGAISIIADAVNNLSDMGSSVVSMLGFRLASKPADPDHPYGHGRIEYVSAFVVAGLIIFMGFELLKASVEKMFSVATLEFGTASIIILVISIAVKSWMAFFNRKLGKKISSQALIATYEDSRNDAITTGAILISVIIMMLTDVNIDPYIGAVVALFILWSGFMTAKRTLHPLLGEPLDEETARSIEAEIMSFDGFLGIHDLIAHNYGPGRCFASVHVEVPANIDIVTCHEKIDICEKQVFEKTGVMLTVHMDPVETDNEKLNLARSLIAQGVSRIHEGLTIHDFRMTPKTDERTNLIFDVVLPAGLENKKTELKRQIEQMAREIDETYCCVITFDLDYVGK